MRLTIFALLIGIFQSYAVESYAQLTRLNLEAKNTTIREVLSQIEDQSEFFFLYNGKLVDVNREVSLEVKNKKISDVLEMLFEGTNTIFTVVDRQIVLTPAEMAGTFESQQQKKTVSGKVTSASGEPLPGVTVMLKGTISGTITNPEGNFSVSNVPDDGMLVFSFIGMKSLEVVVGNRTSLSVIMEEEAFGIEEVVAVGYGSSKKRDITGAISTVKSEQLTIAPITSTTNALTGKIPGLQTLQPSGEPGNDASRLSIRGFGNALVIVDGVEQGFNNITGAEIESISILKDASSAIYGARAGNGVILVTTKRGKPGKPTISMNSSYTFSGNINFPKTLTAGQYTELYREAQINSGVAPSLVKYSEADVRNFYKGTNPDSTNTDWWKATMKDWSPMQQHDISLRGGNENVSYFAFGGYTRQEGMFKTGDNVYDRFNVRSNIDATVAKNFKMELNLSAIIGAVDRSFQSIDEGGNFWNIFFWARPTNPAFLPDKDKVAYSGGPLALNPVITTNKEIGGYNQINTQNLRGNLGLKYIVPFIRGLEFKASGDYQYSFRNEKTFSKFVQTYTYNHKTQVYTKQLATGSTNLSESMAPGYIFTGQFSANYSRTFKEKHEVAGLVLYELISSYGSWISAYRRDFLSTSIDYLFAGSSSTQQNNGSATESGRASYIGRLNYKFNNKYLAEVTLRYDGSPNFPADTRWGFFPSFSAGWIISEESFIKNKLHWLSNLKLRASYSNTGYDNVGAFQYIAGFNMGQRAYSLNGATQTGIAISGIPNPDITWERMTTYNAGLDFSLLENSLYGEADVFYRKREGILGTRVLSLPSTFGATLPSENINSMDTRGMEFMLGFRKSFGDWMIDVNGNVSWARSKWIHFDEPDYTDPDDIRINKKSGKWTDLVWGYKTNKLFTSQSEIDNLGYDIDGKNNSTVKVGDIKYLNLSGDKKLDWRDYKVIGKTGLPQTIFGLNFRLVYRNFDLDGLLQGASGRSMPVRQGIQSEQSVTQNVFKYRWTEANPDVNAIFPRQNFNTNNFSNSDFWLKDATYIRLKVLSIGYRLPKEMISKIGFSNMRIYFSGTNLLTFSGLKKFNIDPETPGESYVGGGYSGATYPHQRTLSVGLNLSF